MKWCVTTKLDYIFNLSHTFIRFGRRFCFLFFFSSLVCLRSINVKTSAAPDIAIDFILANVALRYVSILLFYFVLQLKTRITYAHKMV